MPRAAAKRSAGPPGRAASAGTVWRSPRAMSSSVLKLLRDSSCSIGHGRSTLPQSAGMPSNQFASASLARRSISRPPTWSDAASSTPAHRHPVGARRRLPDAALSRSARSRRQSSRWRSRPGGTPTARRGGARCARRASTPRRPRDSRSRWRSWRSSRAAWCSPCWRSSCAAPTCSRASTAAWRSGATATRPLGRTMA